MFAHKSAPLSFKLACLSPYGKNPIFLHASFSDEIWNDCQHSPLEKTPLTVEEVFVELVSQRLAQGFQLIVSQDASSRSNLRDSPRSCSFFILKTLELVK
jgi:hypothetical protein